MHVISDKIFDNIIYLFLKTNVKHGGTVVFPRYSSERMQRSPPFSLYGHVTSPYVFVEIY